MRRRQLHDAVAQADLLGALARCGEEHLGGGRMRILFKKMMLDLPGIVVAEPVGQFDLVERVMIELPFVVRPPWARKLQLVENAKFHAPSPDLLTSIPPEVGRSVKVPGGCSAVWFGDL